MIGGQNPESRIMRGGWWLRKESRIQSSESGQGCERLCRKEERIQNPELDGTLERERRREKEQNQLLEVIAESYMILGLLITLGGA